MKFNSQKMLAIACLSLSLQGCFFIVGAAAGAAAIAVVYDHRTIKLTLHDTQLANKIADKISRLPGVRDASHIEVTVFNKVVLLTGQTPYAAVKQQAENIAHQIGGDVRVYNQLTIEGPNSTLTRTSDSWITAKIRGEMLANENLKSSSIKVVTESGVVYLMGIVNKNQADIAVDIARHVDGVQKVVKVFG